MVPRLGKVTPTEWNELSTTKPRPCAGVFVQKHGDRYRRQRDERRERKAEGGQAEEEHEPTLRDIHEQRARQALLNGDSLIATTAAIGTSSPSSIAVIISQPSSL